jgi:hypothetical protein
MRADYALRRATALFKTACKSFSKSVVGPRATSGQIWRITGGRGQPHSLINVVGNRVCLDDLNNSNADHNKIQLRNCTDAASQLWHQAGEGPLT